MKKSQMCYAPSLCCKITIDEAESNPEVRVVIVTGAGNKAFSSGHDLDEPLEKINKRPDTEQAFTRPMEMRKPVIAAVNGHCHAVGLILALSCDIRLASENAMFASPGARLGMLPEGGQIARLPQLISQSRAMELMFTAKPVSAVRAYEWGMLNRVVSKGGGY